MNCVILFEMMFSYLSWKLSGDPGVVRHLSLDPVDRLPDRVEGWLGEIESRQI